MYEAVLIEGTCFFGNLLFFADSTFAFQRTTWYICSCILFLIILYFHEPMSPDSDSQLEHLCKTLQCENAALKKQVEWLSRQLFGRVLPKLLTFPDFEEENGSEEASTDDVGEPHADDALPDKTDIRKDGSSKFREHAASYRVSVPASAPPDLPMEDVTLELPLKECRGMFIAGFERSEAIAMRSAVVSRNIRRSLYLSNDDSGLAAAAPAPALFPDPSGGPLLFDASFVACVADLRIAGISFQTISERLNRENGLVISDEALRCLVLSAAELTAPVCTALFVRTLPDWMNLRRMFEEAKAGGDWFADEFLKKIHALAELEEHASHRAARLGGAPEDLYRERRTVRAGSGSIRIVTSFFERCRELLCVLDAASPLAETLRYALEHESFLSGFLYDPRLEMSRANPETPLANPLALLAVCADECRTRGVSFRAWFEHALIMLKQPVPPPLESLFPRGTK